MRTTLFALLCLPALAAAEPVERVFPARIAIDATGAVTTVEPVGEVDADLVEAVRGAAAGLAFEPASIDGRPVPSRSTAIVRLRFDPEAAPPRAVEVVMASHASAPTMRPPRYPPDMLRNQLSALVVLRLAVDADGRVLAEGSTAEHAEAREPGGRLVVRESLYRPAVEASLAAAGQQALPVEEVDGVPRASTARIPVTFCFPSESKGCTALKEGMGPSLREPVEPGLRFARPRTGGAAAP